MEEIAPVEERKKLVVIDTTFGEMNVFVTDPDDTLVVLVSNLDDEEPSAEILDHLDLKSIPDDARGPVTKVLEAQMSEIPASPSST